MQTMYKVALTGLMAWFVGGSLSLAAGVSADRPGVPPGDLSPTALVASGDGKTVYIACATANQVAVFDTTRRQITRRFAMPGPPSGLALSLDETRLFVTCAEPASRVCVTDTASGKVEATLVAGHTALSPVLSRDARTLLVCDRFNDAVSVFDLAQGREVARIRVVREPVSAALTRDGRFLLVANHLPAGRSDKADLAAAVTVIDVTQRKVTKQLRLPNGSTGLRQISVSPDGKYAAVPHTVGRFQVPVTQIERGWVNTSALTVIDLAEMQVLNTVLLDEVDRGAANPWATAWSADGQWLCVTHAGTHELSVIAFPALLKKLSLLPATPPPPSGTDAYVTSRCAADVPNDLSFLHGLRRRVQLNGNGPRGVVVLAHRAFVASYFSDSLDVVDLAAAERASESISLNSGHQITTRRRGEMLFNDATLCFQGWQSCATCHGSDARVDGLNWDLLNDGIGNPKNTKSLLGSCETPPVMSLGVRANAGLVVRAGLRSTLYGEPPEEVADAMDEWLESLKPAPSPHLVNGRLSEAAQRGEQLFKSPAVGCAACHPPGRFTDSQAYNVGTHGPFDGGNRTFDTPTLVELWRTAPYLHDGSAITIREVLATRNPKDRHGRTSHLTPEQIDDLTAFVLSL